MFNILEISRKTVKKKEKVFKPSFKCFKNEKIIFIRVILKLECLFCQNIYIISSYIKFVERFRLKKKVVYQFKKHAIYPTHGI
jgi:hypothetical protein